MIYLIFVAVAVAGIIAEAATALTFARVVRSHDRQQARERELLLNQICHLSSKPWLPAPAEEAFEIRDEPVLVGSPEQMPDW